jgi:4-amino-4-deoxy-L-arabinose transferase-like glycosyltransferase
VDRLEAAPREPLLERRVLVWTLAFVAALTALRIVGLFLSPVELYPEEAQYWVWSRHLDFGYFSKPPMIAWLIRAATTLGGDREAFVRLLAPVSHAIAALALQRACARLYGGWTGFWAAALYSLAPGVQLSAAVVATDAPLMAFCALALWAYAAWLTAPRATARVRWAALLGLWIGLAGLSKYAVLYLVIGLVLHAVLISSVRRRWRPIEVLAMVGVALLALAPNLIWNGAHGFQTVAHTAADAAWQPEPGAAAAHHLAAHAHHGLTFDPRQAPGFLLSQLGVFGPIPFIALVVGLVLWVRRPSGEHADRMLLTLTLPALVIILVESLVARANANWAAIAYVPGAALTAAWVVRWRAWRTLSAAVATQGAMVVLFFAAGVSPALANKVGLANSFKRARGWEAVAALVDAQVAKLETAKVGPLSSIAIDDRFTYNALAYYRRQAMARDATPMRMWVREARPHNEAETAAPLTQGPQGQRVLFVDVSEAGRKDSALYRNEAMRDFRSVEVLGAWRVWTDPKHAREVVIFLGHDFHRRPRDPRTGLPVPL